MYENRMMSYEIRTTDDVFRHMQRQHLAQQKRSKQATIRPATRVRPIPRPAPSWAVVSAQLELKRKQLQLVGA